MMLKNWIVYALYLVDSERPENNGLRERCLSMYEYNPQSHLVLRNNFTRELMFEVGIS